MRSTIDFPELGSACVHCLLKPCYGIASGGGFKNTSVARQSVPLTCPLRIPDPGRLPNAGSELQRAGLSPREANVLLASRGRGLPLIVLHARPGSPDHRSLLEWHQGRMRTLRSLPPEAKAPAEMEPMFPGPDPEDNHWIELRMADKSGNPAAGIAFRLELPDGTLKSGSLDDQGCARVQKLGQGNCKVSFPFLDDGDWGDEEDKHPLEAQIVNALGEAQKDMAYELALPDGSTLKGKTDAEGNFKHQVAMIGDCWLTLPDYGKEG